ncbi:MAG: hypothetical protein KC433_14465 [Anaerolineales bacterium]|nr:hypothetical protein [Anaerolineales bacterium]MCB8940057.1 hypothetical protein [Ardenticatenaceae bacterium]
MVSKLAGNFVFLALLFLFVTLPACTNQSSNGQTTAIIEQVEVPVTRIVTREIQKITTVEVTRIVEAINDSTPTIEPIETIDPNHNYTGTYEISCLKMLPFGLQTLAIVSLSLNFRKMVFR